MPGLIRGVARTAVVAGTASAVAGRVNHHQQEKWAGQEPAAVRRAAVRAAPPPQYVAPAPVYAAPAAPAPAAAPEVDRIGAAQGARRPARAGHPHRRGVRRREGEDPQLLGR